MWKNAIEKNVNSRCLDTFVSDLMYCIVYDGAVGFDFPDSYEGRPIVHSF